MQEEDVFEVCIEAVNSRMSVWRPSKQEVILTHYMYIQQLQVFHDRAVVMLRVDLAIPSVHSERIASLGFNTFQPVLANLAVCTEDMEPSVAALVYASKQDLTAPIMCQYLLSAYGDILDSEADSHTLDICIQSIRDVLPVRLSLCVTNSPSRLGCACDSYGSVMENVMVIVVKVRVLHAGSAGDYRSVFTGTKSFITGCRRQAHSISCLFDRYIVPAVQSGYSRVHERHGGSPLYGTTERQER